MNHASRPGQSAADVSAASMARAGYNDSMMAQVLTDHDDTPVEDKIIILRGATWADYQRLLEMRGDRSAPRIAYLEGELEIMSPSRPTSL